MTRLTILFCALFVATTTAATPPEVVIFDVHGVLLKENIHVYAKEQVYKQLLKEKRPMRSFKKSAPFKTYMKLLHIYKPLADLELPAPPACSHVPHEVYHLFAGTVSPQEVYQRVCNMITQAATDGHFADTEHMQLMVQTLIDVIFDPDHIHRDKFMIPLYEGLRLMQTIHARGMTTAILSNVPHEWMMQYLYNSTLRPQFAFLGTENILTSGLLGALKPEAKAFDAICAKYSIEEKADGSHFNKILLIDDTQGNVDGARALGMRAVFFDYTDMPRVLDELKKEGVLTAQNVSALTSELLTVHTTVNFGSRTLF